MRGVLSVTSCREIPLAYGGADRDRTDDLSVANAALSQLSYCPKNVLLSASHRLVFIVGATFLEA